MSDTTHPDWSDRSSVLVYCDWLDDHGQPRGAQALRSGSLRFALREEVIEYAGEMRFISGEVVKYVEKTEKICVLVTTILGRRYENRLPNEAFVREQIDMQIRLPEIQPPDSIQIADED